MSRSQPLSISVTRMIPAPPDLVYDRLADLPSMPRYSPETIGVRWLDGATAAAVGVRFRGRNAIGRLHWSTSPTITAAERGIRLAFQVPGRGGPLWTFDLEPAAGGTVVTESMHQQAPTPWPIRALQRSAGVNDRADHLRDGMRRTLARLASSLDSEEPGVAATVVGSRSDGRDSA